MDVVNDVVARYRQDDRVIRVQLPREVELIHLAISPELLDTILSNLIDNALQHACERPEVTLRVVERGEQILIEVEDNGPGVGEEAQAKLFSPFFTTKEKGTGLGLALSRKAALAHGGDLVLGTGKLPGACFELSISEA